MDIKRGPVCKRRLICFAGLLLLASIILAVEGGYTTRGYEPEDAAVYAQCCDLDRDNTPEQYVLQKGRLTIWVSNELLWESPADWQIESFVLGDANNDGADDLLLVLWKKGSYGSSKPFWVNGPDTEWTNHLFVYGLVCGHVKPVWMSSALICPILTLEVQDINCDGKNELVVLEGSPLEARSPVSDGNRTIVLQWQGWGFYQVDLDDGTATSSR